MRTTLYVDGYVVLPRQVPRPCVDRALRVLGLMARIHGATPQEIADWQRASFYPWLNHDPAIEGLLPAALRDRLGRVGEQWCDPQTLVRLPDPDVTVPLTPHRDTEPDWADGRRYRLIAGVSLTRCGPNDGALAVWPGSHRDAALDAAEPVRVATEPGDVVVMDPALGHAGTLNLGARTRVAVYFRLLERPAT